MRESNLNIKKILEEHKPGLSKRELLAGMVMQGLLASVWPVSTNSQVKGCAKRAVECTDALLAELSEGEGKDQNE